MGQVSERHLIVFSSTVGILFHLCLLVNGENRYTELDTLKPSQREALDAFKQLVLPTLPHDYMKEDIWLVKTLAYNNFKVQKAVEQLNEMLKWREENNVDKESENQSDYFAELQKEYPIFVDGYDKEERPICEVNYGSWPVRKGAAAGIMKKLTQHFFTCAERATVKIREQQAKGKNVTQFIAMADLKGFSVTEHVCPACIPMALNLATGNDKYYPNMNGGMYLINTPDSFASLLRLIRPVMSPSARAAMKIFTSRESEWKPFLEKRVDFSQISNWYGGAKDRTV